MSTIQSNSAKSTPFIDRFSLILIIVLLIITVMIGIVAFNIVLNMLRSNSSVSLPGVPDVIAPVAATPTSALPTVAAPPNSALPQTTQALVLQSVDSSNVPAAQPWVGSSRVTILIMGLDFRDWQAGEIPRTDVMILMTVDPLSKTAGMLSIPRDMWVNIPGFNYAKINTAYFLGAAYKTPGGGPGLAMETVQDFIGVPINYYAQIDFYAFEKFIDAMGGLDMHIRTPINVDPLGKSNTVTLEPGVQTLSGAVALGYARQRHTQGGDFDRAKRQQEVIIAIRDQVMNFNMLPALVGNAPKLYGELSAGIHTNLTLPQVIQLAFLAQQINPKDIKRGVIDPSMVYFGKSPDNLDILIPIADNIRVLRDQIFTTGSPLGQGTEQPTLVDGTPTGGDQPGSGVPTTQPQVQPTPAPTYVLPPEPTRPATYTMQNGEFPFCIARRYNIDPAALLSANNLGSSTSLSVGFTLTLPQTGTWTNGSLALLAHPGQFTVHSGDTLNSIACYYGDVYPESIAAANGLVTPYTLTPGQVLNIP